MFRRVRELCSRFPKSANPQGELDNVAAKLFKPDHEHPFIQSNSSPRQRFGINVSSELTHLHNSVVPEFDNYGPNEKFLINKILQGPDQLLYIIGGPGVGKTSFLRFLSRLVLPTLVHGEPSKEPFCPRIIYFNFNEEMSLHHLQNRDRDESVQGVILEKLCTKILGALDNHFFSLEDEVESVWESLLQQECAGQPTNDAMAYIRVRLRDLDAERGRLLKERDKAIELRKLIRREMMENQIYRSDYVAALVKHVQETRFKGHPCCLILIVDNVDVQPSLQQHALRAVLQPFILNSGMKTIVTARETTFFQRFDGAVSVPADRVPYCGISPWSIVDQRLSEFIDTPESFCNGLKREDMAKLAGSVRIIRRSFGQNLVKELFEDLCGDSIRVGLILGQRMLNNSVFDPLQISDQSRVERLRIGDLMRALIVGEDATYMWSSDSKIENIFQVNAYRGEGYFLKLRVLACLTDGPKEGIRLSRLLEILPGFEYPLDLICDGLNEMMLNTKRLIWSDSVLEFAGKEDLLRHGHSFISVSPSGIGYSLRLFKRLEYVQEVMLDTDIDSEGIGSNWDYGSIEDRFSLIQLFVRRLFDEDAREMKSFCSKFGPREYRRVFRNRRLLSLEMLETVRNDVSRILVERRSGGTDFIREHLGAYDDLIIQARNLETTLFGH